MNLKIAMFSCRRSASFSPYPFLKLLIILSAFFLLALLHMYPCPVYAQGTFYTIHVSSYRIHKNAIKKVSRLEMSGFEAFYRYEHVKGKAMWYRVYIGRFGSRNEAKEMVEALRQRKIISYYDITAIKEAIHFGDKTILSPQVEEKTRETTDTDEEPTVAQMSEKATENGRQQLISFHGFAKNETAYRIHSPSEFIKIKNILFLSTEGKFTPSIGYKASGRAYHDAVFDLTDTYAEDVEEDQESEVELRDAFVDISVGNWDLRLGKQQIVWGEAMATFVADIVNPKDLREFILPEFDDIRIPQWSAKIEYFHNDHHLELIWIPDLEFNKLGVTGSEFEFRNSSLPEGVGVDYHKTKEPTRTLENSEIGFRASTYFAGWNLNAFYLHSWDHFATMFWTVTTDPDTNQTIISYSPEHKRIDYYGFTFAKEWKGIVYNGEFVYTPNKYFVVTDLSDKDGVERSGVLDYLLGFDYTFLRKVDLKFQFIQRIITEYDDKIYEDRVSSSFSIWLGTGFLESKIEPEILWVSGIGKRDWMIRPKVKYNFRPAWQLVIGSDVFGGKDTEDFGQFHDKDRIYSEITYKF